MKNYDSAFQSTLEKSRQYIADNRTWVQVNQTSVSTISWPPDASPLAKVHLTTYHSDPQADDMSCWPAAVPLLITRCLYLGWASGGTAGGVGGIGGYVCHIKMGYCKVLLKTQDGLLWTIEHELNVNWSKVSTILGHQIALPERGYIWTEVSCMYISTIIFSGQFYLHYYCSLLSSIVHTVSTTLHHQIPLLGGYIWAGYIWV